MSLQHPGKKINLSMSVLDLVMVNTGSSPSQSMQNSLDLGSTCGTVGIQSILAGRAS